MPGIHVAAAISAVIVFAIAAGFLAWGSGARERRLLAALLLIQLPMSAVAFYGVRVPLDGWLRAAIGGDGGLYTAVTLFYAPLTEEPAKLWPLLLPFVWRRLERGNAFRIALALGVGFGIGEIGFLAERVARVPAAAALPWHAFGPFILERVMVCVWHPAFVAVTVWAAARGRARIPLALAVSMALHFIGNFPLFLASRDVFGFGPQLWPQVLFAWIVAYTLAMAALLALLAVRR